MNESFVRKQMKLKWRRVAMPKSDIITFNHDTRHYYQIEIAKRKYELALNEDESVYYFDGGEFLGEGNQKTPKTIQQAEELIIKDTKRTLAELQSIVKDLQNILKGD